MSTALVQIRQLKKNYTRGKQLVEVLHGVDLESGGRRVRGGPRAVVEDDGDSDRVTAPDVLLDRVRQGVEVDG